MSEKYRDLIIVGTDLAGLIAGAFLAKRGLSVTVLNFEKDVLSVKKNIQPNLVTHLESRLFKSILGRLSILDHEVNIIRKLEVPYQVVLPRHRLDVFRDRNQFDREINREFPLDQVPIRAFYDRMDDFENTLDSEKLQELILPKGIKNRWKFSQLVKKNQLNQRVAEYTDSLGFNEEVRAFLEAQIKFLSQTHSANPFTYQMSKILSNNNCLLFEVQGGVGHLKKLFLDKIDHFNGQIKNEVTIENFQFEKGKIISLKLGGFDGVLGCRHLLWNDEIPKLQKHLPKTFRNRKFLKQIHQIKPRYYHFSIQYQMNPKVIPVGMRENLLLIQNPTENLSGANFLHLNLYRPAESDPEEKAYLTVSYLLDSDALQKPSEEFAPIHKKITQQLHQLFPFSEGKLQLAFPLNGKDNTNEGTLFPLDKADFEIFRENAQANPIYEIEPNNFGGLFPFSNRTPYKNLYLTSPEILATLGMEGKFLLGLKTTDLLWNQIEHNKKKAIKQRRIIR